MNQLGEKFITAVALEAYVVIAAKWAALPSINSDTTYKEKQQ